MEVELAALIQKCASEQRQIETMRGSLEATKVDLATLRNQGAEEKHIFETAMRRFDDGHAKMQAEHAAMESELMAAVETLSSMEGEKKSIEARCESLRQELTTTARDLELLAAGEMLHEDKERLAIEAGLDLADTNLRDGPPKLPPPPLTPRAIKDKIFIPQEGHYQPQQWGGEKPAVRAVFGGSLGKFASKVIAQPSGHCEICEPPTQVTLDYSTILALSAELLGHHFGINEPFQKSVRQEALARRFGIAFGALALARALFMVHEALLDRGNVKHWLYQVMHLEHLDIECPEAILRMAQHVGLVAVGGRTFCPAASERAAAEMAVLAFVAVTGLDEQGQPLEEATVLGVAQALARAPFDERTGFFSALTPPSSLLEVWPQVAGQLAERCVLHTTTILGDEEVECTVHVGAEQLPPPEPSDTAGTWYHCHRAMLDELGINAALVQQAQHAADPTHGVPPESVAEFNRLCATMGNFAEEEEEEHAVVPGRSSAPHKRALAYRGLPEQGTPPRVPARTSLRMAVEQLSRFMLSNKILLRRTLATGSFSSLGSSGSIGQFVYHCEEQGWVSGMQQSPESAVIGAILGLGGQMSEKPHFSLKVGNVQKRQRAIMRTSEREKV